MHVWIVFRGLKQIFAQCKIVHDLSIFCKVVKSIVDVQKADCRSLQAVASCHRGLWILRAFKFAIFVFCDFSSYLRMTAVRFVP